MEKEQQKLWAEARANHRERTQALADYRKESLTTSHQKQGTLLEQKIAQATDPRIQLMRRSELANAEADYRRRIQEFDKAIAQADITSEPVAYGIFGNRVMYVKFWFEYVSFDILMNVEGGT